MPYPMFPIRWLSWMEMLESPVRCRSRGLRLLVPTILMARCPTFPIRR